MAGCDPRAGDLSNPAAVDGTKTIAALGGSATLAFANVYTLNFILIAMTVGCVFLVPNLDAAYQVAQKMVRVYPTDLYCLVELALLHDARGEGDEARRLFGEILILDPQNETARRFTAR
jgi:hypothetical protein